MYRAQTVAIATDKVNISANYIERADFDMSVPLHAGLHYLFIRGAGLTTYGKSYELRSGINCFLDFVADHNSRVIPSLKILSLSDIGVEEFSLFLDFIRRIGSRIYLAIKLRSSLGIVARKFDDGMPVLQLPRIEEPKFAPTEPLGEDADRDFYKAMYQEVDRLIDKRRFQASIKTTKPYDKWEVYDICHELYSLEYPDRSDWKIDPLRAAATLAVEGYPFYIPANHFECMERDARTDQIGSMGRTPLEFVLSCCMNKAFLRRRAPNSISYTELFRLIYPTSQDQATLALFIQRQAGWNKETVLALDKDNFIHMMSEVAHNDIVLVNSHKLRSQSQGDSFIKPKFIASTSNRSDPYSVYNIICLANDLSESCRGYLRLDASLLADDKRHRSPFLFLGDARVPWTASDRVKSLDAQGHWNAGVNALLGEMQLMDEGVPLTTAADIQGRLRVTSLQKTQTSNSFPVALTALLYGHSDPVTTDTHYDSSVFAMADRRKRFQAFQENFIKKGQLKQFTGALGNPGRDRSELPRFRIFTIIGHDRPLWACSDCTKPIYPGSTPLPAGTRCTRLDKCNGCGQWWVLEDSLPFVMERLATLEISVEQDPRSYPTHADEINVLRYVIEKLYTKELMKDANAYRERFDVLLPFDLSSLIAYIED
ncbi:hypothetical protein [Pseudomonas sp. NFR16]|uniref:hypothetical protein n=1 Tax=Pseudomonas sp. NFR16 TaxID=1566248 RepID=UPI00116058D9|nr:hypothetical protein [Pseudomonas sp. NFR16]